MPYNGSGTFNRVHDWTDDADAGIDIEAERMDEEDDGFATGLSNCITKDGQTTPTANLPMGTYKHTGVGNASARDQYVSAGQLQDGGIVYVSTVGGTGDAITLTPSPAITAYAAGQCFRFQAGATCTTAVTVNVSGVGAKDVKSPVGAALTAGNIVSGDVYEIHYNGTEFRLLSPAASNLLDKSTAQEFTAQKGFDMATLTDGANISWNLSTAQVATVTLGGNRTLDNPTNQQAGSTYAVIVKQDATGSRTLAYGTSYKFPQSVDPVLTTTANAIDVLTFISDGTNMLGVAQYNFG